MAALTAGPSHRTDFAVNRTGVYRPLPSSHAWKVDVRHVLFDDGHTVWLNRTPNPSEDWQVSNPGLRLSANYARGNSLTGVTDVPNPVKTPSCETCWLNTLFNFSYSLLFQILHKINYLLCFWYSLFRNYKYYVIATSRLLTQAPTVKLLRSPHARSFNGCQ